MQGHKSCIFCEKKMNKIILEKIDSALVERAKSEASRNYAGASSIGTECDRALFYKYKINKKILNPRTLKIFKLGNLIENEVIEMLRLANFEVFTHDENGNQFRFSEGSLSGGIDGVIKIDGDNYLLEIKSAKNARWNAMQKGELEMTERAYYAQVQVYMHFFKIKKCIFLVYNKDTSGIFSQKIFYDNFTANHFIKRSNEIYKMNDVSEAMREYKSKEFFKCKMCEYSEECWSIA